MELFFILFSSPFPFISGCPRASSDTAMMMSTPQRAIQRWQILPQDRMRSRHILAQRAAIEHGLHRRIRQRHERLLSNLHIEAMPILACGFGRDRVIAEVLVAAQLGQVAIDGVRDVGGEDLYDGGSFWGGSRKGLCTSPAPWMPTRMSVLRMISSWSTKA